MRAPAKTKASGKTIRATVRKGRIVPVEALGLPEGTEVEVTIRRAKGGAEKDAFLRSAGAWKGKIDAEKWIKQIYKDRLRPGRTEPSARDAEEFRKLAGGWKGLVDGEALIRQIYRDRLVRSRPRPRL